MIVFDLWLKVEGMFKIPGGRTGIHQDGNSASSNWKEAAYRSWVSGQPTPDIGKRGTLCIGRVKTIIKPMESWSAIYYHCEPASLNTLKRKTLLLDKIFCWFKV